MDLLFLNGADDSDFLAELRDPAKYRGYLQTMSHFSGYSWRNIFLIYKQMPHATKLADFEGWKKQYGRNIIQGSKSIKINIPIEQKPQKRLVEKTDHSTGTAAMDENGKRIMEEIIFEAPVRFKQSSVFDISQTEGSPVLRLAGDVTSDEVLRVAFDDVLRAMSPSGEIRQIVLDRLDAGVIADSVAYVVCWRFGMDIDTDFAELELNADMLELICKQSHDLITYIEDRFAVICKERGLDPMTLPKTVEVEPPMEPPAEITAEIENATTEPAEPPVLKHTLDTSISIAERNQYGYTRPELLPLRKDRALALFRRDMTVYLLYKNNTEAIARYISDIQNHDGIYGIAYGAWQNSREYIALSSGNPEAIQEAKFIHDGGDSFAVYQIKAEHSPLLYYKSYEELQDKGLAIDRHNYTLVYTAPLPAPPSDKPADIFVWVNAERLDDYNGRILAVSDVISIKKDSAITSHYANGRTFKELLSFIGEEGRNVIIETAEPPRPQQQAVPEAKFAPLTKPVIPPPLDLPKNRTEVSVYRLSAKEAENHGVAGLYEHSRMADFECAEAVSAEIQAHKKGEKRYDLVTPTEILVEKYGAERMMWVLSRYIITKPRGFSVENVAWANDYVGEDKDEKAAFTIHTHPAVLDAFMKHFRAVLAKKPTTFSEKLQDAKKKSEAHNKSKR